MKNALIWLMPDRLIGNLKGKLSYGYIGVSFTFIHIHTHMHTYTYTHIPTHIHIHIYTHIHTCMYTFPKVLGSTLVNIKTFGYKLNFVCSKLCIWSQRAVLVWLLIILSDKIVWNDSSNNLSQPRDMFGLEIVWALTVLTWEDFPPSWWKWRISKPYCSCF